MPSDKEVNVRVNVRRSGTGDTQAKKGMKDLGIEAKKTKKELSGVSKAAVGMGKSLVAAFGAVVLFRFVQQAVVEFSKYNRIIIGIKHDLDRLGIAHDNAIGRIKNFLENMEDVTGTLRQSSAPVFLMFLGILADWEAAMAATSLANDIAAKKGLEFKNVAQGLAQTILGEATEAVKQFGVKQTEANEAGLNSVEVLRELIEANKGFAASMADAQAELEKTSSTFNDLKVTIGEEFAPALGKINAAIAFTGESVATLGAVIGATIQAITFGLQDLKSIISQFFRGKDQTIEQWSEGFEKGLKESFKNLVRNQIIVNKGFQEQFKKIWGETGEKAAESFEGGFDKLIVAGSVKRDQRLKAASDREVEAAKAKAEQVAIANIQINERILQESIEAAEELSDRQLILRLQLLNSIHGREMEAAEKLNLDLEALDIAHELAKANLRDEFREAHYEKEKAEAERLQALKERILEREKRDRETEDRKAAEERQRKLDGTRALFVGLDSLMGENFAGSKALAVAQAIINTYEGATKAIAQGGILGPAMASIILAVGLAHVAKIRSTERGGGGGFDNPEHDAMARVGGKRWAFDVVRQIGSGFHEGFRQATGRDTGEPAPQIAGNVTTETHLHIQGFYGGRRELRRLSRDLRRTTQQEVSRELS